MEKRAGEEEEEGVMKTSTGRKGEGGCGEVEVG